MRESHGYELTPQQAKECLSSGIQKIKSALDNKCIKYPDDELEFIDWLRKYTKNEHKN